MGAQIFKVKRKDFGSGIYNFTVVDLAGCFQSLARSTTVKFEKMCTEKFFQYCKDRSTLDRVMRDQLVPKIALLVL
jgi:hypothetical protein